MKLPQAVFDLIERYRTHQQNYIAKIGDKWQDTERLFTKWNGEPMHSDTPIKVMRRFCDKNGLRYVNINSFRRSSRHKYAQWKRLQTQSISEFKQ